MPARASTEFRLPPSYGLFMLHSCS